MIRINLLPSKEEKKKGKLKKEWVVLLLSLTLFILAFFGLEWKMGGDREEVSAQIANAKKDIAYYKSLSAEVNKAKESQKTLQEKLNVIETLRKEKSSPAKVLDEISIDKPEKIQLESLKKEGAKLGIEGIALDDETVANFMTSLRKSKMFKNVDLVVSEQIEMSKLKLKKFILSCEIILM